MLVDTSPYTPAHTEALLSEFLLRGEHAGNMSCVRMGAQICRLMELVPDEIPDDPEFQALHPLANRANLQDFSHLLTDYRSVVDPESALLQAKAIAIDRYNTMFKDTVEHLNPSNTDTAGRGASSIALRFSHGDREYVARKIENPFDAREVDKHFSAALLVEDIDHMEHVEAISFRDRVTIAPRIPGKDLNTLTLDELSAVTGDQLSELYEAMCTANQRGVYFDGNGYNFLYDTKDGFTAVDMSTNLDGTHGEADEALQMTIIRLTSDWLYLRNGGSAYGHQLLRVATSIHDIIERTNSASPALTHVANVQQRLTGEIKKYEHFEQSVAAHKAAKRSAVIK